MECRWTSLTKRWRRGSRWLVRPPYVSLQFGCQADNVSSLFLCPPSASAYFKADPSVSSTNDNIFFRCSFSYPNDAEMEEGAKRLGRAIRRSYGI